MNIKLLTVSEMTLSPATLPLNITLTILPVHLLKMASGTSNDTTLLINSFVNSS